MSDTTFAEQPTDELPDVSGMSDEQLLAGLHTPKAPEPAPVAAPVPEPAPAAAAEPAPAPAAPVAAEPAPAPAAAEPAPAPIDPTSQRDPNLANNFRLQAQNAIEQQALALRAADRNLSLADALVKAHENLGIPSPFAASSATPAAAPAPAAPEPAADPLADIQKQITDLTAQKKGLNKVIDADEVDAINDKILELREQKVRLESQQAVAHEINAMQGEQALAAIEQKLHSEFADLQNARHPFTIVFNQARQDLYATADDATLADPELELKLAAQIADQFANEFKMSVKRASKPAAAAPAPAPTVTQPAPAPVAAAPAAAPRPSSAAAPVVGAPAGMSPVMGIAPQNPKAQIEALIASDAPLDDAADALLLSARFGTAPPPSGTRFQRVAA